MPPTEGPSEEGPPSEEQGAAPTSGTASPSQAASQAGEHSAASAAPAASAGDSCDSTQPATAATGDERRSAALNGAEAGHANGAEAGHAPPGGPRVASSSSGSGSSSSRGAVGPRTRMDARGGGVGECWPSPTPDGELYQQAYRQLLVTGAALGLDATAPGDRGPPSR